MKKSNYLTYLNEYQGKLPVEVQKTFKNPRKQLKPTIVKSQRNKNNQHKQSSHSQKTETKKTENNQNLNPNLDSLCRKQGKLANNYSSCLNVIPTKVDLKDRDQRKRQTSLLDEKDNKKQQNIKYQSQIFNISLTRCNFQPTHPSQNLYLIQTQINKQLIVCQKCAQRFALKTKISDINKSNYQSHPYAQLIVMQENSEQFNKKIRRIQIIQKQNMKQGLQRVQKYYGELINRLVFEKQQLQIQMMQVYNINKTKLGEILVKNQKKISLIQRKIEQSEKSCIKDIVRQQQQTVEQILNKKCQDSIQLSCLDVKIPLNILQTFENQFRSSKYCIKLSRNYQVEDGSPQNGIQNQKQIKQINQFFGQQQKQQQIQETLEEMERNMDFSHDFLEQIPFNVQYSISGTKQSNYSHIVANEQLTKISSSQELLMQSIRNQQSQIKHQQKIFSKITQKLNQKLSLKSKTQPSTQRVYENKQVNSCNKRNFVKQLHVNLDQYDDLICDQDLVLSSSPHPIYERNISYYHQPVGPLNLYMKKYKKTQAPMTLSELDFKPVQPYEINKITSILGNSSFIALNENKHEISFQLDENLIIDANILPSQENQQENYDIISPAFKII